jgi:drug/metabolite transporter (DMT)-like permease
VTGGNFSVHGGTMILFCGSIMYAVQIILIGKYIDRSDPLILVTVQVAVGTMVNLLMALITREQFQCTMLWNGMPVILYTGVFSLGVANLCQFAGQKKIPPSVTAIACSFESVFGLIFGMILLNEHMTILKLIGCLLIFAAVILSQCKDK